MKIKWHKPIPHINSFELVFPSFQILITDRRVDNNGFYTITCPLLGIYHKTMIKSDQPDKAKAKAVSLVRTEIKKLSTQIESV